MSRAGTKVDVFAAPKPGWQFTGWSGDAGGTTNPLSVVVDGHKTIIGNFEELPVATELALFEAEPGDQGIEVRWSFGTAT